MENEEWNKCRRFELGTWGTEIPYALGIIRHILVGLWLFSDGPFTIISSRVEECVVPPSHFFYTLCSSLFIYHNLLSTLAALLAAVSLVEILVSCCSLSHFVTLFSALRTLSQNCSEFWLARREKVIHLWRVVVFDLITNLGSVVCPRNPNIHLHDSSVKSCSLSGRRSRSLSKYSDSKLKLSMQTEYARLYQLKCTVRKIQGILKEFHNWISKS